MEVVKTIVDVIIDAISFTLLSRFMYGRWWWDV